MPRKPPVQLVPATALAQHLTISTVHVGRLTADGVLFRAPDSTRYDLDANRKSFLAYLQAMRPTDQDEDARRRRIATERIKLRHAQLAVTLVNRTEVIEYTEFVATTLLRSIRRYYKPEHIWPDPAVQEKLRTHIGTMRNEIKREARKALAALDAVRSLVAEAERAAQAEEASDQFNGSSTEH